jgi:hypothetical protein
MELYNSKKVFEELANNRFCYISGESYNLNNEQKELFEKLRREWDNLPDDVGLEKIDNEFRENLRKPYRKRRWGQYRFFTDYENLEPLAYKPFGQYQMKREVCPWIPSIYQNRILHEFLRADFRTYRELLRPQENTYCVNVHLFRVEDGKPSPEGPHQDEVLLFSVRLINYINCRGGEAEIYDMNLDENNKTCGRLLKSISLSQPLDTYFVRDSCTFHKGNEIKRKEQETKAIRDVLIISFLKDS